MQFHLVTWLEVIGAIIGIVFLGTIGTMITPSGNPSSALLKKEAMSPERVIENAQAGYQVETCVRDIAPRTVLSASASGTPELIVLEGAPVTECFPGLSEFVGDGSFRADARVSASRGRLPFGDRASGADLTTSVTVLPVAAEGTASVVSASSSDIVVPEKKADTTRATSPAPIPSGGGGSVTSLGSVPSADRFETCRIRLFGEVVPAELTVEEYAAFEQCLSEDGV